MARGACDASAQVAAMLAEVNRDSKKRSAPFTIADFNHLRHKVRRRREQSELDPASSVDRIARVFGAE